MTILDGKNITRSVGEFLMGDHNPNLDVPLEVRING